MERKLELINMTEKEKLQLISEDMYCKKYDMHCEEVPYEILNEDVLELIGLGFSAYECDLLCKNCKEMLELE